MANSTGQIEIPTTRGHKKSAKKQRKKKLRQLSKDKDFVPKNNRYKGYN